MNNLLDCDGLFVVSSFDFQFSLTTYNMTHMLCIIAMDVMILSISTVNLENGTSLGGAMMSSDPSLTKDT